MAFLAGSVNRLMHEQSGLTPGEIGEVRTTAAALLRMFQACTVDGAAICVLRSSALWIDLFSLKEQKQRCILGL